MPLNFNKHAEKGNKFLKELAIELGDESDIARAGRMLQSVFRTLRSNLTPEESFQLLSQFPMALKAVYINGWNPYHNKDKEHGKKDFIEAVIASEGGKAWHDFSSLEEGREVVGAVFRTMRTYVSEGEMRDIIAVLPEKMKTMVSATY